MKIEKNSAKTDVRADRWALHAGLGVLCIAAADTAVITVSLD